MLILNERITEDIVREHFKKDELFENILFEEQKSSIPKIQKLLKGASKKGNGVGKPEFIISGFSYPFNNLIFVIECKADTAYHESKSGDCFDKYAVDGVKLYSSYLSEQFDVIGIAVSGCEKNELLVSNFYFKNKQEEEIFSKGKLYTLKEYLNLISPFYEKKIVLEKLREFAKDLNEDLHKNDIAPDKRAFLLSGILLALEFEPFKQGYKSFDNDNYDQLPQFLVNSIVSILKRENIASIKQDTLTAQYKFIETIPAFMDEKNPLFLRNTIEKIYNNVAVYLKESKDKKSIDAIGEMYTEFLRYANNVAKMGVVLTPPHITEFMCDLIEINEKDTVIDICCGTAGFLIAAMSKMLKMAAGDSKLIKNIKEKQIIGTEKTTEIHALACANMILHGDGKSHIIQEDCFKLNKEHGSLQSKKITKSLLNPPYKKKEPVYKQLEFIEKACDLLEVNGKCAAIIQMSCVTDLKKETLVVKKRILNKHTLEAVISMPNELFHPTAVVTCIAIFSAHVPHNDKKNTWFGFLKDDGFEKKKNQGRVDSLNKWGSIKENILDLYINRKEIEGISIQKSVSYNDEWCAEAYLKTNFYKITEDDFLKTIKNFVTFKFSTNKLEEITKKSFSNEIYKDIFNEKKWKLFILKNDKAFEGIFSSKNISRGKRLIESDRIPGDILYFSASESNNGCTDKISNPLFVESNAIIYTTFGDVFYIDDEFTASDEISIFKHKNLNVYTGMFLATILKANKYRYSFGRKAFQNKLLKDKILLPITKDSKIDWEFMEKYIKTLEYSANL